MKPNRLPFAAERAQELTEPAQKKTQSPLGPQNIVEKELFILDSVDQRCSVW
jgi:hypothetical protein